MNPMLEQAEQLTKMWTELAARLSTAPLEFDPADAPPEAARQVRSAVLKAMSDYVEQFMRSPQFLETMKQSMDASITFRQQLNDLLTAAHQQMQGVARQDVDSVMLSLRHMETRILDRLEQLSAQVQNLGERVDALEGNGRARPPRPAGPSRRGSKKRQGKRRKE